MYSWLAAVGAACLWLAAAAPTTLARRAGAVALAVGALYLHYFALLLALPSALLAASAPGTRRPAVPRSAVARVAATVAVAGLAVVAAATLSREWDTLFAPRPTGHPFVPLAELPLRILFGITLNTPPMPDRLAVALLVVPVLAGALPLRGESPRDALRRAGRLWLFIAAPLAAFYVVSLSLPLFAERYFVILMPPVVLLVARAMAAVWTRSRLAGLAAGGALLLVFGYVAASQQGSVDKADYRALGAHLRAHARSADALMVVMPYNERSVRFYAGPSLAAIAPPPAPPGVTAAELERASAPVLAGRRRVWLVLAEPEQWDPGGAIAGWLAARSSARTSFAWRSVRLELFELR